MQPNINFHIWFRVCRPIKRKYNLSTNCVMVLNGAYVLHQVNNKSFSLYKLRMFVTYYSANKINVYIKVLIDKGFIIQSGNYGMYPLYSISPIGIEVIEELKREYDRQFYLFCNTYNIEV